MTKIIVPIICITFTSVVLKFFLKWKYKRKLEVLKGDTSSHYYHQCKFVNMKQFNCRPHLFKGEECCEDCSAVYKKEILSFISSAKLSICMCMYILSLNEIICALINANKRGVQVRVITDKVMLNTDVMQTNFGNLKNQGIPFKTQPSEQSMMHHKFCLIDKEDPELAKVLFGSLNLTAQALTKNFDAFIITNNLNILKRFSEEFEDLWEEF